MPGDARGAAAADADAGDAGIVPAFVVAPGSTDEAAAVHAGRRRSMSSRSCRAGAGGRLGWGMPPSRCDLMIDMSRMSSVVEHSSGDLVARVQAGARMGDVAAALGRDGQEIALDVPDRATVGGVVASGLAGPRRLRYGTPRDLLIGITIVRADGTVARSGGKVVKNVAGYDLGKLLAGSAGTLALITEATFRLHPLPAARAYVTAEYVSARIACDAVAAAANSPLVASAVELTRAEPGGPIRIGVLLEGSAEGVDGPRRCGWPTCSARPRSSAEAAALVARRARRRGRHPDPRLLLGVGAPGGARRRRRGRAATRACPRRSRARRARACSTCGSTRDVAAGSVGRVRRGRCGPRLPASGAGWSCSPRRRRCGRRWPATAGWREPFPRSP